MVVLIINHQQSKPIINIFIMQKNKQKPEQQEKVEEVWQCSTCTFKNHPKIGECQICNTKRPNVDEQMRIQKKISGGVVCHACKKQLDTFKAVCPYCKAVIIPEESGSDQQEDKKSEKKVEKQRKMISCRSCGQENDAMNEQCVFCESSMRDQILVSQIPSRRRAPKKPRSAYRTAGRGIYTTIAACRYCKLNVYGTTLESHQLTCPHINQTDLEARYLEIEKNHCMYCYEKFDSSLFDTHMKNCTNYKQFYSVDSQTYQRCTKLQIDTMIYMHKKNQKLHWIAEQSLLKKISSMGQKPSDLQNLHHYILNYAPIIIHMHVNSHMQFFVKDTHYRNQFETKKSSGSLSETSRINWEDRMFDKKHHHATPFERVKYGTINFTNDPKGVMACVGYGQSYFLLKSHVRNRCTVTDMDSSSPSATIATFQSCYHLLNKLPDAQLKAAFQGSKANEIASNVIGSYKQIQIHGPVEFKKDIERVYVNKAELTDPSYMNMVKQFCKKNDLQYQIFGNQSHPHSRGGGLFGTFGTHALPTTSLFGTSAFASSSIFSAPVPTASTTHLFTAPRRSYPAGTGVRRAVVEQQKQPEQGVDYI